MQNKAIWLYCMLVVLYVSRIVCGPGGFAERSGGYVHLTWGTDWENGAVVEMFNAEDDSGPCVAATQAVDATGLPGEQKQPGVVCISLGPTCSAGLNLKRQKLSQAYYPFDFIITPFESLCAILKTQFKDFMTKEALVGEHGGIQNTITRCSFPHDFKNGEFHLIYDTVAAKFQRRIDRFYKSILDAKHVYFFRTHATKEEASMLHALLCELFPKTSFSLIVPMTPVGLEAQSNDREPWGIPGIMEFPLFINPAKSGHTTNHGRAEDWDRIFRAFQLI